MPQDKIAIYGPKGDGTYVVEFKTAADETLAISLTAIAPMTAIRWMRSCERTESR
jgi:hypothetical protein